MRDEQDNYGLLWRLIDSKFNHLLAAGTGYGIRWLTQSVDKLVAEVEAWFGNLSARNARHKEGTY